MFLTTGTNNHKLEDFVMDGKIMAEGKTKIIRADGETNTVLIESKDDITAGDGAKRDVIPDKGKLATTTTVNCFRLLSQKEVPNHFIEQTDERTFRARLIKMIPLEIVVRRIATGSYLKRCPDVKEGTILPYPVEFFLKDDARHDPFVIHDFVAGRLLLFDPRKPLKDGFLTEEPLLPEVNHCKPGLGDWFRDPRYADVMRMQYLALRTFGTLEEAWGKQGITLVDLKIECGFLSDGHGQIIVADVIDNDSWRLWPGGNRAEMVDKQVYRELANSTPEALGAIKKNYARVAELTTQFCP